MTPRPRPGRFYWPSLIEPNRGLVVAILILAGVALAALAYLPGATP